MVIASKNQEPTLEQSTIKHAYRRIPASSIQSRRTCTSNTKVYPDLS